MVRIERKVIAYNTLDYSAIEPQYLGLTEEIIRAYVTQNPMPEDPEYSEEDMIHDLTGSSGIYTLPSGVKEGTIEYIETLLNNLL